MAPLFLDDSEIYCANARFTSSRDIASGRPTEGLVRVVPTLCTASQAPHDLLFLMIAIYPDCLVSATAKPSAPAPVIASVNTLYAFSTALPSLVAVSISSQFCLCLFSAPACWSDGKSTFPVNGSAVLYSLVIFKTVAIVDVQTSGSLKKFKFSSLQILFGCVGKSSTY